MRDMVPNLCEEDLEDKMQSIPRETWNQLFP